MTTRYFHILYSLNLYILFPSNSLLVRLISFACSFCRGSGSQSLKTVAAECWNDKKKYDLYIKSAKISAILIFRLNKMRNLITANERKLLNDHEICDDLYKIKVS